MNPADLLQGQVALITGAGKGLGRAYAIYLASLGAKVVVNNRTSNDQHGLFSADAVVEEIERGGGRAVANYEDVEFSGAGKAMVEQALGEFGRLDIVISNAGIDAASSFHKLSMQDFQQVMQINFQSVAELLHVAWPHMRNANYGKIIVSSSSAGVYGNHGQSAYSASKAALIGLMKALAIEGASRGICVNAIAPYAVTQLTQPWFPADKVARFAPESVAPLVAYLASPQCSTSGSTFVLGADHVRLIRNLETGSVDYSDSPRLALQALEDATALAEPVSSANDEFQQFLQSL